MYSKIREIMESPLATSQHNMTRVTASVWPLSVGALNQRSGSGTAWAAQSPQQWWVWRQSGA
eukprot:SAG31_NODE_30078_length_385_cov_1.923077_1_plen_61_part_01